MIVGKHLMKTSDFDYLLPPERIAQQSVEPRDSSRLLVLDRQTGAMTHKHFFDVLDELHPGDVLVMNNTKVFRARLHGIVRGKDIEVFLLRVKHKDSQTSVWEIMARPGKSLQVGDEIEVGSLRGKVLEKSDVFLVQFDRSMDDLMDYANNVGEIPVPPYVERQPQELEQYQTVYAQETGSVAAPTAGFHFTQELLESLRAKGIEMVFITLHVGIGTFRPVKTETLEEHKMHAEFVNVSAQAALRINLAKQQGRRVIAVGTTTVRTLEGVSVIHDAVRHSGEGECCPLSCQGYQGDVNLFIKPGFTFRVVDALITNFHLPKSSLLALVSAFAGRENIFSAYEEAIQQGYRFYSFGDAMFIR